MIAFIISFLIGWGLFPANRVKREFRFPNLSPVWPALVLTVLVAFASGCAGYSYFPPTMDEWRAGCAADGYTGQNVNMCAEMRSNERSARVRANNARLGH